MKIKGPGKVVLVVLVAGGAIAGKVFWWDKRPQVAKESIVTKTKLPDAPEASLSGEAKFLPLPSEKESVNGGTKIKVQTIPWNALAPVMYANGGSNTTKESLFDKANLQVEIVRVDDCMKTIADMVKFAQDYKNDPSTSGLVAVLMGDGMPSFLAGMVKELQPLGANYQPIIFYASGKSYGEDQLMGPQEWKSNPKAALGKNISCVLRDGDQNIALIWAGNNGMKVNPDETAYDPNAVNFIAASDFNDAGNKYINNYCEKKKLIVDGKKIAKDTTVCIDAVATWTPGDVNVAKTKGGLVRIASTKEFASQMPATMFTIKKWAYDHMSDVQNMIAAMGQAGDQVRSFDEAKMFAAKVTAKVYDEKDAAYWLKYYNGVRERDALGKEVDLGGSMAFNLKDAANFFGLGEGTDGRLDRYKAVYTTIGDIYVKMYPEYVPSYPPYNQVVDKTFLSSVLANNSELMEGEALKVVYSDEITEKNSSKSYQINFETGKATIMSSSYSVLEDILKTVLVAEGLKVGVYGHTDNVGSETINQPLSEARAEAVRSYLLSKGLPSNRIEAKGFGSSQPIANNGTAAGKAMNRRVEMVLGN